MKECQQVTMYKNNSRKSSKLMSCSPLQLHRKLKDLSSVIGSFLMQTVSGKHTETQSK